MSRISVLICTSLVLCFVASFTLPASAGSNVFVNGHELTRKQLIALTLVYHRAPFPGRYWYDTRSGAWGLEGRETLGFLMPGHSFGPLAENASNGNTGVFINGREINIVEAAYLQRTFGAVYRGHWWLDGRTGYYGIDGNPMPLGNINAAIRAQQRSGDNFGCGVTYCANDNGHDGYVDVGGSIVSYSH